MSALPDPSTPFGARVAQRLRDELVIWMTTVGADGTPQPNPVWFLWDGETFLVYNRNDAKRLDHIRSNPRVALNFDGNGQGGDIAVITGTARITENEPPVDQAPAYLDKYRGLITRMNYDPAAFGAAYGVTVRITPDKVRGF